MHDIIFCLVGPSGSGKTTIAKILEEEGFNVIQSYTTRHSREPNEWGYTFTTAIYGDKPPWEEADVIAYNNYNGNHYWATKGQYEGKGKTVYIIDPPGDTKLREVVDCPVVTIFLHAGWDVLYERLRAERGEDSAKSRLSYDRQVFAAVKTDWTLDTQDSKERVMWRLKTIMGRY